MKKKDLESLPTSLASVGGYLQGQSIYCAVCGRHNRRQRPGGLGFTLVSVIFFCTINSVDECHQACPQRALFVASAVRLPQLHLLTRVSWHPTTGLFVPVAFPVLQNRLRAIDSLALAQLAVAAILLGLLYWWAVRSNAVGVFLYNLDVALSKASSAKVDPIIPVTIVTSVLVDFSACCG